MKNKIDSLRLTENGKPIACLDNLTAVLQHEKLSIDKQTLYLSGAAQFTIENTKDLTSIGEHSPTKQRFKLLIENLLSVHGLPISTSRYLPLINLNQFMAGASHE